MASRSLARSPASPAATGPVGRAGVTDPSGGRGNAARAEELREGRGLVLGADTEGTGSRERMLAGGGNVLFATAGDAYHNVKDDGSYTEALLLAQAEHPEWSLAEAVRYVNAQNVNGMGSELAMTEEAAFEMACPVAGVQAGLVIGNSGYANLPSLPGAERDARSVASTYEGRGYTIQHEEDLSGAGLVQAFERAGEALGEGDEMLLYYAGHGVSGALLGVDATEDGNQGEVRHGELLAAASRLKADGVKTEVVIDACKAGGAVDQAVAEDEFEQAVDDVRTPERGESDEAATSIG